MLIVNRIIVFMRFLIDIVFVLLAVNRPLQANGTVIILSASPY